MHNKNGNNRLYTGLILSLLLMILIIIISEISDFLTLKGKLIMYAVLITNILLVLRVEKNKSGFITLARIRHGMALATLIAGIVLFFCNSLVEYFPMLLILFLIALILYAIEEILNIN